MDRKSFLKCTLGCAVGCMTLEAAADQAAPSDASRDAAAVRAWISQFVEREESRTERVTLVKLLEERGGACCQALDFRQRLIKDSEGDVGKLVELLGKIVGPENAKREGDTVILIYPMGKCGCGWSPKRAPVADDPYCECSKANNQRLFEIVTGKAVRVEVTESPRRGGTRCRFAIHLA